jgi:hypothetical protein
MTDHELAAAYAQAVDIERLARAHWTATDRDDQAERDAALVTVRKATELGRMVERWITARACRAAMQVTTVTGR